MRVIIVNTYSISRSTGLIARSLLDFLRSHGHQAKLCCRGYEERFDTDPDVINLGSKLISYGAAAIACLTGVEGDFFDHNTNKLIKIIEDFRPDVVQLYSLHGYYINQYKFFAFLKAKAIPCIYSMIDEHAYMGRCCYSWDCNQFKECCYKCPNNRCREYPTCSIFDRAHKVFLSKAKAYNNYDRIIFTGPKWVCQRAKESALLNNKRIEVLDEPIDFGKYFHPMDTSDLRKNYNISKNVKIILNVSNMKYPEKGGGYFLKIAEKLNKEKDLLFICIGYNEKINVPLPGGVISFPYVTDQNFLAKHMALADVFVHCSLVDTQPNICLDAMGCGTPIIGFDEMGNAMIVPKDDTIGIFVKNRDVDVMAELIKRAPFKTDTIIKKCHEYAVGRFSSKIVFEKLINLYQNI